jgi:hypothetical protein
MDDEPTTQPILGPLLSTIKALAWPATILFVAIAFWRPIHRLVDRFSPLVDNISSVTVGGVQFTVGKEFIEKRAPEAVRTAVAKLSPQAVRYLLENERGIKRTTRSELNGMERELVAAGLCTEMTYKDLAAVQKDDPEGNTEFRAGMDCGSKYEDVRVFLLELIPELMKKATSL